MTTRKLIRPNLTEIKEKLAQGRTPRTLAARRRPPR